MESPTARAIAARFMLLRRAVLGAINSHLEKHGVSVSEYNVLFRLSCDAEVSQQDLGLDAGLESAGLSRLVADLAKRDLVKVAIDRVDRRRRVLTLTPTGRAREKELAPLVDGAARGAVTGLTPAEERALLALLDKAAASVIGIEAVRERIAQVAGSRDAATARERRSSRQQKKKKARRGRR